MLGQQFVQGFRVGVAGQADVLWGQDKSARFVYSAPGVLGGWLNLGHGIGCPRQGCCQGLTGKWKEDMGEE